MAVMTTLLESDMGPMDIGSKSLVINETSGEMILCSKMIHVVLRLIQTPKFRTGKMPAVSHARYCHSGEPRIEVRGEGRNPVPLRAGFQPREGRKFWTPALAPDRIRGWPG